MSYVKGTNRCGSDGVNNQEKNFFHLFKVHIQVLAFGIYRFLTPTNNILIILK